MAEDQMRSPAVPPQELSVLLQQELAAMRRQRSRMGWLMAGTAVVGIGIVLAAAFGPLRDRIADDVTARLQRDLLAELRQPMQQEATATARQETARLVREDAQNGALHGLLLAEAQRLVAQGEPLRAAMADRAAVQFRAPQRELAGFAFRILDLLDPGLAQQELAKHLATALAEAPDAGPVDTRLTAAFQALAQPRPPAAPAELASVSAVAEQALRLAQRRGDAAFTAALGGWFATLGPAEAVAEWLQARAAPGPEAGTGLPVVWRLLLQDGRPPARSRLLTLLESGPEAEARAVLAALAAPGQAWPALPPAEARRLLAAIEAKLPPALLAPPGLDAPALEAWFGLNRAAAQGQPALRFALPVWGDAARAARQPGWNTALRAMEGWAAAPAATGAAPVLPWPAGEAGAWPILLQRLVAAVELAAPGQGLGVLLPEAGMPAGAATNRLAVLSLAAAAPAAREAGLPALLLPQLLAAASSPARDIALLRLADGASPAACTAATDAALARPQALPAPAIAALLGCAAGGGSLPAERIAAWLRALPPDQQEATARLAAVAGARPEDMAWTVPPGGSARLQLLADLGARQPAGPPDAAALDLLAQLRRWMPAEIDSQLADGGTLLLPAAGAAPEGSLPEWATAAFWTTARPLAVAAGTPWEQQLTEAGEQRLSVTCPPALALHARLEGGDRSGLALMALPGSQPPRTAPAFGEAGRDLAVPCAGGVQLLVRNAAEARLRLEAEPPVREVPPALRPEDAAKTEPLRPDQPLRLRLGQGQSAYFRVAPEAGSDYTITTRRLAPDTDTVLEALSEDGRSITEDDDGGKESLASRIVLQQGDVAALVRAGTLGAGQFELLLTRETPLPLADFATRQAAAGPLPPPGTRLHIRLQRNQSAFFAVPDSAELLVETEDLRRGTDTVLELLDADSQKLTEDDDSGQQQLASALLLPTRPRPAWLRVGTLDGGAGDFTLSVRPAPAPEPADFPLSLEEAEQQPPLTVGEVRHLRLRRRQAAYFALPQGRDLAAATRNLEGSADTVLELLDAKGVVLAEDDDGGEGELASRLDLASSRKGPFFLRVRSLDGSGGSFDLVLEQQSPAEPPRFATSLAQAATRPPLASGAEEHLRLARNQSAYFALPPGRGLVALTRNLRGSADTVLEVLDAQGRSLAEDDDGGSEELSSRLTIPAARPAFLRVGTLEDAGGEFDLRLEGARRR
jgi:hypothetical protein